MSTCRACQHIDLDRPNKNGGRICRQKSRKRREAGMHDCTVRVAEAAPACPAFMARRVPMPFVPFKPKPAVTT